MAEKSSSRLRFDDFVNAVHADPANAEPTVLLAGYLGRSPEEGNVRVYLDPGLSNWLEVPEAEVIHSRPIADSPLGGSQLWVRASAQIKPGAAGAVAPAADEEGGGEKAAVGADTGVFNPMATIHPTIWTQFCPTGVGCIATIPCLPPSIGCPPGGELNPPTFGSSCTWACPRLMVPHYELARAAAQTVTCPIGPTGWQGCGYGGGTAATVCTQLGCPTHMLGCPNTSTCPPTHMLGCPSTSTCPPAALGAVGPTGTQGCTQPPHCVGQTGWHTCACPPGYTGWQGCVGAGADAAQQSTAATLCTRVSPCVGHTGWQGCAGADAAQQSTAATLCTRVSPCVGHTGWHTCACPLGPTGTQGCGQGGLDAVGPTGTQGCTQPGHCVGQTGWHTCACPIGPTGYQGCGQGGLDAVVGPTGTQGCTQPPHCVPNSVVPACFTIGGCGGGGIAMAAQAPLGPTGTQGCTQPGHCVGQTGWHTCACPIGPTGTQGCVGGQAAAWPTDPTASTRCFICPPLDQGGYAAAQANLPGPTGMLGCTYICGAQQNTTATLCTQVGCRQSGPVITLLTVAGCPHPSWVDACPTRLCGITVSGPCLPYTFACYPGGRF